MTAASVETAHIVHETIHFGCKFCGSTTFSPVSHTILYICGSDIEYDSMHSMRTDVTCDGLASELLAVNRFLSGKLTIYVRLHFAIASFKSL